MDSSHKLMGKQQYPNRKWSGDNMHTHKIHMTKIHAKVFTFPNHPISAS